MGKIYGEIKQGRPFARLEQEAMVTLLRTSDILRTRVEASLKPWGLSPEQYNILRILRGAPDGTLPTLDIAARMISRAPNITRLIDKLIEKKLVTRCPSEDDRRVVGVRISAAGLKLVNTATPALEKADASPFTALGPSRLKTLIALLDAVRTEAARE